MAKLYDKDTLGVSGPTGKAPRKSNRKKLLSEDYEAAIKKEHRDNPKWGSSVTKYAGIDLLGFINTRPYITNVLDYGCGKGMMQEFLKEHAPHIIYYSYDPGVPGKEVLPRCDTDSKGRFDFVITCDVMEHIEPEFVGDVCRELFSLTKYVMYNNISCKATRHYFKYGPFEGRDLHLSVHDTIWWRDTFQEEITDPKLSLMEYRMVERRHNTSDSGFNGRCTLIHERSG